MTRFPIFTAAILIAAAGAHAQTLGDFKAGKSITGDPVDLETLKGRVVAIEYWGTR